MTPQERQLIDDLFDRLSKLEGSPRDPRCRGRHHRGPAARAERSLRVGADGAGAGRSAEARQCPHPGTGRRMRREQAQSGSFLDSMRDALFGQGQTARLGANVRAAQCRRPPGLEHRTGDAAGPRPGARSYGQPYGAPQPPPAPGGGGGSFLGTAAAAAAGMVGGSLLLRASAA